MKNPIKEAERKSNRLGISTVIPAETKAQKTEVRKQIQADMERFIKSKCNCLSPSHTIELHASDCPVRKLKLEPLQTESSHPYD